MEDARHWAVGLALGEIRLLPFLATFNVKEARAKVCSVARATRVTFFSQRPLRWPNFLVWRIVG
jgi:hypothetical protein